MLVVNPVDRRGRSHYFGHRDVSVRLHHKIILAHTAHRTCPVFRDILKGGARGDSTVRVTYCRIINPVADSTSVFFHSFSDLNGTGNAPAASQ